MDRHHQLTVAFNPPGRGRAGIPRFLVTTADERTWRPEQPTLFLGEWCRLYHRRPAWEHLDALVQPPYGLSAAEKERDRDYLRGLISRLSIWMAAALNAVHRTRHAERYWQILLGQWLQRAVYVVFNRHTVARLAVENNEISGTIVLDRRKYHLATQHTLDLIWATYDSTWNNVLYGRILESQGLAAIELLSTGDDDGDTGFVSQPHGVSTLAPGGLTELPMRTLRALARRNDAVIVDTYLPRSATVELHARLRQVPATWPSPPAPSAPFSDATRRELVPPEIGANAFESFLASVLPEMIPTCFVEGYRKLTEIAGLLDWPASPKLIYTCNRFDTDEIFKTWTASQVERGTRYVVGQHGGNYGTWAYSEDFVELDTTDKFISWGWEDGRANVVPGFVFTTVKRKRSSMARRDTLLLILRCLHSPQTTFDNHFENFFYQDEQFRFVGTLGSDIRPQLRLRLHHHPRSNQVWSDGERWRAFDPSIELISGREELWPHIDRSRLVVVSYDSTGLLENLAIDNPVIGFWYGLTDELLPEARRAYERLREAGILFETPEEAARGVINCWNRVDEWWSSSVVQDARAEFCEQYARRNPRPIEYLAGVLRAEMNRATNSHALRSVSA